jgi:transcriptional regulator with XRE-family HTH domain
MPKKPTDSGPPPEDEELDIALIILRAARRWKQNDLARASGIGNSSISDYERKKKAPGRKNLRKMLAAMGYREGVLELTHWFLHELRTTQRLAPGEVDLRSEVSPLPEAGLGSRVDQVANEVGRTTERLVHLLADLLRAHGEGAPGKGEGS